MQKIIAEFNDYNILDNILSQNDDISAIGVDFNNSVYPQAKNLYECVNYFVKDSKYTSLMFLNSELSNKHAIFLAKELAKAIDKNAVNDIKYLKNKYVQSKEFAQAKEFLNKKCKEVWNVFEYKNKELHPPKEAMKALGITNCPSLDFLLKDSLTIYENDNGTTTVDIITNILNNKNLSYSFDDIYNYLKNTAQKYQLKFNPKTVHYLTLQTDFDFAKLSDLNINKQMINQIQQQLKISQKLRYYLKCACYNITKSK